MPSIAIPDESEVDDIDYYTFEASQFELFPKVNKLLRTTICNLGLWNLENQYPDVDQATNDNNQQWALGQIFIRDNGLNIKWQKNEAAQWQAVVSFKKASNDVSVWIGYLISTLFMILLSLMLFFLTRMKFDRIKKQNEQFKKIKILTSNYELEISPEFEEIFKAQQQDKDFIEGKEGATTSTHNSVEMAVRAMAPRAEDSKVSFPSLTPVGAKEHISPFTPNNASSKKED